ncbi:MAG TPA: hypothetical protein VGM43_09835 [Bryobacteraceae bacterium]|jgi:hypothetical protein
MTPQEAKEFLVERIAAQAERDGVTFSEDELKMLDSFGTRSVPEEFEQRLKGVIRNARQAAEDTENGDTWENAVEMLRWEDPYLPRLIDLAGKPLSGGQFVRAILIPCVIIAAVVAAIIAVYRGHLR